MESVTSFIFESLLWLDTSYVLACLGFRSADSDAEPMYLGQDGVGESGPYKRFAIVAYGETNWSIRLIGCLAAWVVVWRACAENDQDLSSACCPISRTRS